MRLRICLFLICLIPSLIYSKVSQLNFDVSEKNYILLIDSSKSMEVFDPNELREAAVRMFSILLPKQSYAGVYQFASTIEKLAPFQKVDPKFRSKLSKVSNRVHSKGVMTDLNSALILAAQQLALRPGDRHIILISDGFIESGVSDKKSEQLKKQFYQNVLPQLSRQKVHVHIISTKSKANEKLIKDIIHKTSGIYQEVSYPEELTEKLVYIFDRTNYQSYQINEATGFFDVTNRAKEVAIIVNDADARITLVDPEGNEYIESKLPGFIRWKKDYGYQSINVNLPIAGRWYLRSNRNLDNRVIVFDDFKLEVSDLPHHIFAREHVLLNVALMMHGEVVYAKNFLKYLKFSVIDKIDGKFNKRINLSSNRENGIFQGNFVFNKHGQHELTILVESPAFKRSVSKVVHVYSAPIIVEQRRDFDNQLHIIKIYPHSKLIVPDKTKIEALIKHKADHYNKVLTFDSKSNHWQMKLRELPAGESYSVAFKVMGSDEVGRPFQVMIDPLLVYSSLKQYVDMDKVSPRHLPQHLPLVYRFDLINYDKLKQWGYPDLKFPTVVQGAVDVVAADKKTENFLEYDEIQFKNPLIVLSISIFTMIFLIILLFLYMRNRNIEKKRLFTELYSIVSGDDIE